MAGFYGNATSSAKVNLTFDIIYPNRVKMEKEAAGDGVYIGRYVLVEYGNSSIADNTESLQLLYRDTSNNFYYDTSKSVQWSGSTDTHAMYKVLGPNFWQPAVSLPADQQYEVWIRVINDPTDKSKDTLKLVTAATSGALGYASNYGIDKEAYALGNDAFRGFDSTVWQKTYVDGESKYVMIAELNSVIPTFNIKVDAPSQIPNPPHFDSNKTNIYYDMHLQPSWGFRIKKATDGLSDVTGSYDTYDRNDKTISSSEEDLDIYFYKDGLREWFEGDTRNTEVVLDNNYILMRGAKSGHLYESHDIVNPVAEQDDIQELSIQLPAIGQMVKKGWDIIHGLNRDNSPSDSLEGRLKFFRGENFTSADGTIIVKGLKKDEVPLQSTDRYLVGAKPLGDGKWVEVDVDADNARFNISHVYDPASLVNANEVSASGFSYGHNPSKTTHVLENSGEFEYSTPVVDEMGHVIGAHDYKVTLPNSLQNISVVGSELNNTPGIGSSGTIKSDNYKDTFKIKPYDQWITLTADSSDKSIAIGHAANAIGAVTKNAKPSDTTPDFGGTFKVLTISTDETGHISDASAYTITLPKPSLKIREETSSIGSKVFIGASLVASTGELTLKNANVGDLTLTKYDDSASTHSNKIQATDTINAAFKKSQVNLDAEILRADTAEKALGKRIDDLDVTDTVNAAQYVSSVSQTDGKITVTRGDVGTLTLTGYTLPTSVNNYGQLDATHSVNEAFGRLEYRINETQQTINDLDYSDTADNTQIITSVSQTDGKIAVTRDNAGALILGSAYSPSASALISGSDNLYTAISTLEHSVHTLTTNLNTLIDDGDPDTLNSVADLITWVGEHGNTVKDITDSIGKNAEDIKNLSSTVTSQGTELTKATEAIGVDEIQDESGNVTQAASGIKKELLDLRELIQTREISVTSDQGETLIGTVEEVLSGMLTRMSALEEICAIHSLAPPEEENLPTE